MSILRFGGGLIPGLLIPPNAHISLTIGINLLVTANFTLTYPNHTWAALTRILLFFPMTYAFIDHGFALYPHPSVSVAIGVALLGIYGCMRALDTCIISLWDVDPPRWVVRGEVQPLPLTVWDRFLYAVDLTTSLRGNSWFKDTHWDWCPPSLVQPSIDRATFIRRGIRWWLIQYLIIDLLDTLNKSRAWDLTTPENQLIPITSLPWHLQIPLAISVCAGTMISISSQFNLFSCIAVALGNDTANWPPMFERPFEASSLSDFWTNKWHAIFRRCFTRISRPVLLLLPSNLPPTFRKTISAIIIFLLSASVHVLLMYRVTIPPFSNTKQHVFFDRSIITFFLSQPLTLLIEFLIVKPVFRQSLGRYAALGTRCWAWCALLWTGRYWSDVWVSHDFWLPMERVVAVSVTRGLLYGEWMT